jgi:signal transduction histidine kinase
VVRAEREAAARVARIHELEEQHRTLLDNAPLIIFRLDPGTLNLAYLNLHAERLLGVPTAEALATPGFLRAAHADREGAAAFDAAVARAAEGARSLPYEARLSRREGDAIWVRGSAYPLLAEGGRVVAIEGVLADVSAEHAARTRLVQADRLSTLGTLAAGVAHEINNPAAFILLGLDLLDRSLSGRGVILDAGAAESARETLRELRESIRRIVDIARDLRLFASAPGPQGGRRTVVDVNRTVESALSLTRGQLLERAEIEQHLGDVPPVLMDDGRLGQVVVNLLVNAAQAIPRSYTEGNRVRVETRSDGHTVEIEVEDSGAGIPPEILPRIWQPFFTTKGPEVGTGLGLSISREIVERAGGSIRVESPVRPVTMAAPQNPPGPTPRGARFVISLPAAFKGDDAAAPASSPSSASAAPRARVLVVDDEPALGRVLAEELGRHHEVVVTLRAEAALAEIHRRPFDVVLCDLCMPGMSGEALYARVREEAPELCEGFVFMTGVGFGADVERFLAVSGRPILEKPFAASKALDCIARVMRRRALR